MRNTLPLIPILCLASFFPVSSQQPADNLSAKAAAYMQKLQRTEGFSGVVLLARDGKILFERAYGMAISSMMFRTLQTPSSA